MTGPRDRSLTAIIVLCAGVLAVAVGMVMVITAGWLDSTPEPADLTVPACLSEDWVPDSGVCLWDARVQGNGQGTSFMRDAQGGVWHRDPQVKG
ncbi:hypothetical protein [Amycolatopsis rubida]|uniref:Uncharacterized protein n=1 Tax=Amycolatopsis rubida TaxID=112413 RepID=A0A1I5MGW8_9PSEU|nr:hypothetical protein [Amycolatopsis rubida]SFP08780.1 hypothetical protein SAMN05421854_10443 [Amycolatopsis rubida]